MNLYLLIFNREDPSSVKIEEFTDAHEAVERLLEAERLYRSGKPKFEVVLLNAADEDDLRRTHSRFFESIDELLEPA